MIQSIELACPLWPSTTAAVYCAIQALSVSRWRVWPLGRSFESMEKSSKAISTCRLRSSSNNQILTATIELSLLKVRRQGPKTYQIP